MSSEKGILNRKIKDAQKVKLTCSVCGSEYEITYGRYRKVIKDHKYKYRCKKCFPKSWYNDLTKEQKESHSSKISDAWTNKPDEEKEIVKQHHRDVWDNKSEEDKKKHAETSSITMTNYWSNIEPEKANKRREESIIILSNYRETVTAEKKAKVSKKMSESQKKRWKNMDQEEYIRRQEITSKNMLHWWRTVSEEKLKNRSEKLSKAATEWWENITPEEYMKWDLARIKGVDNYNKFIQVIPTGNEASFIKLLNNKFINFEWHWFNKIKYPNFESLFPSNPITNSPFVSPYKEWDFKLNLSDNCILVDIDGSIHDSSKIHKYEGYHYNGTKYLVSDLIKFYDDKRMYHTDGFVAYVVLAYDDNITDNTLVKNIITGEMMDFKTFMEYISFMDIPKNERKYIFKTLFA